MAKKVLRLCLDEGVFNLRLTVGGQKALTKKFGGSALDVVLSAVDDLNKMCAVLTEALSWGGNENSITDGEAFYDLLVDNDYSGVDEFNALLVDVLECSGLMNKKQADAIKAKVAAVVNDAFENMGDEDAAAQEGGKKRPTKTTP